MASINSNVKPHPSLFLPIPDDIIVSILARILRSYYPKLSLVSKTFRSLILSRELRCARRDYKTLENVLFVCLQLPDRRLPSWFSLWIKPDQTLTNDLDLNNKSLLVPVPSSYYPLVPAIFNGWFGSALYEINKYIYPTSSLVMWTNNVSVWRNAPSMKVTREYNAIAGVLDGKIYVMGGCKETESKNWGEVFDTKTRTWESLLDPGVKLRSSLIKQMEVKQGNIYVSSSADEDYVYDPKEDRWEVKAKEKLAFVRRWCETTNVCYYCSKERCKWFDAKHNKWRLVKGLEEFIKDCCGGFITFAINGGKLFILWDKFEESQNKNKKILCSVIALEKRDDDEVWGKLEGTNVVLTVPSSYVFVRSKVIAV